MLFGRAVGKTLGRASDPGELGLELRPRGARAAVSTSATSAGITLDPGLAVEEAARLAEALLRALVQPACVGGADLEAFAAFLRSAAGK